MRFVPKSVTHGAAGLSKGDEPLKSPVTRLEQLNILLRKLQVTDLSPLLSGQVLVDLIHVLVINSTKR